MKLDRRTLLSGTARLAMAKLVKPTSEHRSLLGSDEPSWHPFTLSLLDRAQLANSAKGPVNTAWLGSSASSIKKSLLRGGQTSRYKMAS